MSSRVFPPVREETEESDDDDDIGSPKLDQSYDQDSQNLLSNDRQSDSPTFDLSYDQRSQDIESQQNFDPIVLDQTQSTDNNGSAEDVTRHSPEVAPVAFTPEPHDFRNIRRTLSGALEVYGVLGVSVVARSSPHMQRRHTPQQQESSMLCSLALWSPSLVLCPLALCCVP